VRRCIIWVDREAVAQLRDPLVVAPRVAVRLSDRRVDRRRKRIQRPGLLELYKRLVEASRRRQQLAVPLVRGLVTGGQADRALEADLGILDVTIEEELRERQRGVRFAEGRIEAERLGCRLLRQRKGGERRVTGGKQVVDVRLTGVGGRERGIDGH